MNLLTLSWNNLQSKPLSTFLSLLLLMLGVGIISLLLNLNQQLDDQFNKNIRGIDMVVGAKGSPLQLILSSVYHIDYPTGNIPKKEADALARHPLVKQAIPLAYGDNYRSYRILGTDTGFVSHYGLRPGAGKGFEAPLEVTAGAKVARILGLKVGDTFFSSHGLAGEDDVHEHQPYQVVGIWEESNTVADQLLLTPVASVWAIHDEGHEEEGEAHADEHDVEEEGAHAEEHEEGEGHVATEAAGEEDRELTAMLLKFRNPMGIVALPRMVNQNTSMQAAVPAIEINQLRSRLGIGIYLFQGVALAIIVISGISVFISLYNSLKERKYELALMRSMGASRLKLFVLILLEGLILAVIGFFLGMVVSRAGMWLLSLFVAEDYHYDLDSLKLLPEEGVLFLLTLMIGILAAALPAVRAFTLNISRTLAEG